MPATDTGSLVCRGKERHRTGPGRWKSRAPCSGSRLPHRGVEGRAGPARWARRGGMSDPRPSGVRGPSRHRRLPLPLPLRGPATRARSGPCLPPGPPAALGAPPRGWQAAPLGSCRGRAPVRVGVRVGVRPRRAARRHPEVVSRAERRARGAAPGRSRRLPAGAPRPAGRRAQGKAVLASKGRSKGLCLRGRRAERSDRVTGAHGPSTSSGTEAPAPTPGTPRRSPAPV